MIPRLRFLILLIAACIAFPERSPAPVIFKPKEGVKYHPPGEEEVNGTAQEIYTKAEAAERDGDLKRALKLYRQLAKKYPHDTLAPEAAYRTAQAEEKLGMGVRAAGDYRYVVEKYPSSPHFDEAIEAQFRIGQSYLNGKKRKILGVPITDGLNQAVDIFAAIVRTAPHGKYTARAQFNIGLAREKQALTEAALAAFQAVVDNFPNDPSAADAQYQIGYIWYEAARRGAQDPNALTKAKTGFEDFLFRYPHSEKTAQARENLQHLEHRQTSGSMGVAKFYDKRKDYRAAVIYYNEVIRQQPGSPESDLAKKRIDQLRAKVGDAALQTPAVVGAPKKKPANNMARAGGESHGEEPGMRSSPADVAPLPPPETDVSLPPPASLAPDNTTAPSTSPTPAAVSAPEPSATPEATATPTP